MTTAQLRQLVANQIGLPASFDGSVAAYRKLTAAQQTELTAGMINYIRNHPGDFTEAQVATANAEAGRASTMTNTSGYSDTTLLAELESQALRVGSAVADVGNGIVNTVSLTGTLLPFVAVAALVIFAWPYIKKAQAPAA